MVILRPIVQFGCFNASSGRTPASCSFVQPRNGPPEAVNRILSMALLSSPFKLWKMALCSLSTGRIFTPTSFASGMMMCPAVTRVSLFASAMSFPAFMAAMVGRMPIIPTMAVTRISASGCTATSNRPSMPLTTFTERSAMFVLSSAAFFSSQTQANVGWNLRICSSSSLMLLPAARAVT